MNIHSTKLFHIFLILVSVITSTVLHGATNSGLNHKDQSAIFIFSELYTTGVYSPITEILSVNFKNKTKVSLDKGKGIDKAQVSEVFSYVLYKIGSAWKIINYVENELVYEYNSKSSEFFFVKQGELLAGVDYAEKKYVIRDIKKEEDTEFKYGNEFIWGSDWSPVCKCIVFEVSKKFNSEHYLLGVVDGALKVIENNSTLNRSDDDVNKIIVKGGDYDDSDTTLDIILESGESKKYNIAGPIKHNEIIWSDYSVRILNHNGLINLKDGELIYPTAYLWETIRKESPMIFDMAADKNGYVLKWDMQEKVFEVEDISTGETIQKYEKFW